MPNAQGKFSAFALAARRTWALAVPYFSSEDKWRARAMLGAIVLLNLAAVYMLVQLNEWNRTFYDALQNHDQGVYWDQLKRFTFLAFAYIVIAVYKFYLRQLLEIRWRAWMTAHYLERWLAHKAFYRIELARFAKEGAPPDNPDQRIQEDLQLFTQDTLFLGFGLFDSVVTLVSFVGILWGLSGTFEFTVAGQQWVMPGFMVWAAVGYALFGSVMTHFIGRPQIGLNFNQQRLEADFRHHMVRVREYSEAIALDAGEGVERKHLDVRFSRVLANYLKLIGKQKNLIWFTASFGQVTSIFPFLVAAPRYFAGAIQLGELMQISSAFQQVSDALTWFVDNYPRFAAWRATTDRLTSFEQSIRANTQPLSDVERTQGDALDAHHLAVALPDGRALLSGVDLHADAGDLVLIKGPSGSGKSTLLRTLAGIWPFAHGRVQMPRDAMSVPQNPYFPDGPLRAALAYPQPASGYSDEQLKRALDDALLPQLAGRLDDEDAWTQKLSGGERQRLALARVFLKQPRWVFADEATSALDAHAERTLYERLVALVRKQGGALVSIAHRPAMEGMHEKQWELVPAAAGGYRVQS
ncbi:MAG TPA: ABC transporter ATP-binding protein/permease [Ramlibacter sp.]|nr:ABC transporter ATP-binding protein/permease [Ramlibacter sp.]